MIITNGKQLSLQIEGNSKNTASVNKIMLFISS